MNKGRFSPLNLRGEGMGKLRLSSLQIDTQILWNRIIGASPLTRQEALLSHPASPCAGREPRPVSSSVTKGSPREGRLPDLEHRAKERTMDGAKRGTGFGLGSPPKRNRFFWARPILLSASLLKACAHFLQPKFIRSVKPQPLYIRVKRGYGMGAQRRPKKISASK